MTSETDLIDGAERIVNEITDRKVFSVVDTIRNRSYPKTVVEVFLDENAAYESAEISEKLKKLRIENAGDESDETIALQKILDEKLDEIESSKLIIELKGISEGDREKIFEEVVEQYPIEYEETKNPLTGEITKKEIEDKERDRLYTFKLWLAHMKSVSAADGSIQTNFTLDDIAEIRSILPIAATAAIAESIEKLRLSTAIFMSKVNEDFLAKR